MNVNCCDIRSQLARGLVESINQMAEARQSLEILGMKARQANESVSDLDICLRLLSCRSNRQRRKIRHGLLVESREIVSSFDTFGSRQDSAFDQARQWAAKLREKADWIVSLWKCN